MMRFSTLIGCLVALIGLLLADPVRAAQRVRICVDQADWRPYMYVENGEVRGLHADLLRSALESVDLQADFRPMPWVRCQLQAELGDVDAIAPLVHSAARGEAFRFPPGAGEGPNRFAIDEIDDVVITLAADGFSYRGQLAELPRPVRVPRGWEIGRYLRGLGLDIDDGAPSDRANMLKLLRDGRGSVVATRDSAAQEIANTPMLSALSISTEPVRRLSYFLAFSRRTAIATTRQQAFWDAVARLRTQVAEPAGPPPG